MPRRPVFDPYQPSAPRSPTLMQEVRREMDVAWLYVFGLEVDEPVLKGNAWVRPHRIGVSKAPGGLTRQGGQWCWWETSVVAAFCSIGAPEARRLDVEVRRALRSLEIGEADPMHGSWWSVARTDLLLTIPLCATRVGVEIWDAAEQKRREQARKRELALVKVRSWGRGKATV